jgi:hypothetical protein
MSNHYRTQINGHHSFLLYRHEVWQTRSVFTNAPCLESFFEKQIWVAYCTLRQKFKSIFITENTLQKFFRLEIYWEAGHGGTHNLSTQESEAEGSWVWDLPVLCSETLSQKNKQTKLKINRQEKSSNNFSKLLWISISVSPHFFVSFN